MGLDVSVYKNIQLTDDIENYNFKAFTVDPEWDWKIKNLRNNGYYTGDEQAAGVNYSYSTHTLFRNALCYLVGIPTESWQGEEINPVFPFSELCAFADNEGCLDWEVSGKLYKDFVDYKDQAKESMGDMFGYYCDWLEIFQTAKEGGVVVFH